MKIGNIIRKAMYKNGISQTAIAKKFGIGRSTVSRWCSDDAMPPGDKLMELVKMLDIVEKIFPDYIKKGKEVTKFTIIEQKEFEELKKRLNKMEEELESFVRKEKRK